METAVEDINDYLLNQLGSSNQDLILHDQILITPLGFTSPTNGGSNYQEGRTSQTDSIQSSKECKKRSGTTMAVSKE